MHLRYFRVRDQLVKKLQRVRKHSKVPIIAGILRRLPKRQFILVGDSGEKDPEIYRFLAEKFPRQIRGILIRDIAARRMNHKRLERLIKTSQEHQVLFRVFEEPEELADVVLALKQKIA